MHLPKIIYSASIFFYATLVKIVVMKGHYMYMQTTVHRYIVENNIISIIQ